MLKPATPVAAEKPATPKKSRKKTADTTTTSAESPVEEKKPRGRKKADTPAVENVMPATPDPEEKKLRGKNPSKQPVVLIESQSGSQITTSDILKKIPAGCESVYVKPEENKAYWVKGDDSGSVDLW